MLPIPNVKDIDSGLCGERDKIRYVAEMDLRGDRQSRKSNNTTSISDLQGKAKEKATRRDPAVIQALHHK